MKSDLMYNNNIQAERVLLIDEQGNNRGLYSLTQALEYAQSQSLDLLQVSYHQIPTCRVLDIHKHLYQMQKKKNNKNTTPSERVHKQKEIKIGTNIAEHDLQTKQKICRELLQKGYTIRISMMLRGREMDRTSFYGRKLEHVASSLLDVGRIKRPLHINARTLDIILQPKTGKFVGK